jgi:hypothetical protein
LDSPGQPVVDVETKKKVHYEAASVITRDLQEQVPIIDIVGLAALVGRVVAGAMRRKVVTLVTGCDATVHSIFL